jgi:hypothetical protein
MTSSPSALPPGFHRLSERCAALNTLRCLLPAGLDVAAAVQVVIVGGETYARYFVVARGEGFQWQDTGVNLDWLARRCRACWMQTAAAAEA